MAPQAFTRASKSADGKQPAKSAVARGLLDAAFGEGAQDFGAQVLERALTLAATHNLTQRLADKQAQKSRSV